MQLSRDRKTGEMLTAIYELGKWACKLSIVYVSYNFMRHLGLKRIIFFISQSS